MALASRDQGVPIDGGSPSASWDDEEAHEPAADVLDPFVTRGLGRAKLIGAGARGLGQWIEAP
eukprot:13700440-Heterocapsa_arctica.AAC.1